MNGRLVRSTLGSRQVLEASGQWTCDLLAPCKQRGVTVRLERCAGCPRCRGLTVTGTATAPRLSCTIDARPDAAAAISGQRQSFLDHVLVGDVMERDVGCVTRDCPAHVLVANLHQDAAPAAGVPVVDDYRRPVGWLDPQTLVCAANDVIVADLVAPLALSINERTPLGRATAKLVAASLDICPVITDDGTLVGVLTLRHVAEHVVRRLGYIG